MFEGKGKIYLERALFAFSVGCGALFAGASAVLADERHFAYTYETDVLPAGQWEFEQWVTNSNGREEGDFTRWDLRSEIEYGVTDRYSSALYLNWRSTRDSESNETEFKGVSWENIYQILNPNLDPVGLGIYGEVSTDGLDYELEGKLLLSKPIGDFILAANAIYEAEWEREDNKTEEEATLEFTAGVAYKINPSWSLGVETRNKSAYPDGLNLDGQEYNTWSVGPNLHYGSPKWWGTLTVLPQVWGNGDGSRGGRQLEHEEELEVRLLVGVLL
jgi:hypothetical protein